jgi:hypothetical protein
VVVCSADVPGKVVLQAAHLAGVVVRAGSFCSCQQRAMVGLSYVDGQGAWQGCLLQVRDRHMLAATEGRY